MRRAHVLSVGLAAVVVAVLVTAWPHSPQQTAEDAPRADAAPTPRASADLGKRSPTVRDDGDAPAERHDVEPSSAQPDLPRVTGRVTTLDGAGIAAATVFALGPDAWVEPVATADAQGAFEVTRVPGAPQPPWTLRFTASGYVPTVREAAPGTRVEVALEPARTAALRIVADDTRGGIAGAFVGITRGQDGDRWWVIADEHGNARLPCPATAVRLSVSAEGFVPLDRPVWQPSGETDEIALRRAPDALLPTVYARVIAFENDAPLLDATFGYGPFEALGGGLFRVSAQPTEDDETTYVSVTAPGRASRWFAVRAADHRTPDAACALRLEQAATCRGVVRDEGGSPLEGARVRVRSQDRRVRVGTAGDLDATAETAADGVFQVDHLRPGAEYVLVASAPDRMSARRTWTAALDAPSVELELPRARPFLVIARDRAGELAPLTAAKAWCSTGDDAKEDASLELLADGSARVTPCGWPTQVVVRGIATGRAERELASDPPDGRVELRLPDAATVRCRVRDREGRPVPNATVVARRLPDDERRARSAADGVATISGLDGATWTFVARRDAATSAPVTLDVDTGAPDALLELALVDPSGMECDVRDSEGRPYAGPGRVTVRDGATGALAESRGFESAAAGLFVELPVGRSRIVEIEAKGYAPCRSEPVTVEAGQVVRAGFALRPGTDCTFEVLTPSGAPFPRIALTLTRDGGTAPVAELTPTDARGRSAGEGLAPGTYRVSASHVSGDRLDPDSTLSVAVAPMTVILAPGHHGVVTLRTAVERGAAVTLRFTFDARAEGDAPAQGDAPMNGGAPAGGIVEAWTFALTNDAGERHVLTLRTRDPDRSSVTAPFLPAGTWTLAEGRIMLRDGGPPVSCAVAFTPATLRVDPGPKRIVDLRVTTER